MVSGGVVWGGVGWGVVAWVGLGERGVVLLRHKMFVDLEPRFQGRVDDLGAWCGVV